MLDGSRAIQVVRAHAREWGLDPARIGYIGFSAGSNMGRSVVAAARAPDASAADPIDRVSSQAGLSGARVRRGTPDARRIVEGLPAHIPGFGRGRPGALARQRAVVHRTDEGRAVAEIHVYQKGRHGFGSGFGSSEFADWMPALKHFLELGGFLREPKS